MDADKEDDIKLGLALSGGGFRAAFFHLGVLARLAELGILPRVKMLSTVSGGSVVGALYYLHIKWLLETNATPTPRDVLQCVHEVETELVEGVRCNLVLHTFLNPYDLARMLASENYSRTTRLGKLYERKLYKKIWKRIKDDTDTEPSSKNRILLRQLLVKQRKKAVEIKSFNRDAAHKVKLPDLIMNAASLNTGRYWRFSLTKLGETLADHEVRERLRLRKHDPCAEIDDEQVNEEREIHYYRLVEKGELQLIPKKVADSLFLGKAVGASSAVPGVFAPVPITGLYDKSSEDGDLANEVIQLVDGGVYDNQGLDHLFRESCTHIITSDGSAPFFADANPSTFALPVLYRINDISMARIRTDNIKELRKHKKRAMCEKISDPSKPTPEIAFFHLRQRSCKESPFSEAQNEALADIRTDLDSFSDIEAYSLMLHGYTLADWTVTTYCPELVKACADDAPGEEDWRFKAILSELDKDPSRVERHLKVGHHKFFRIFRLWREPQGVIAWAILLLLLGTAVYLGCKTSYGINARANLIELGRHNISWLGSGAFGLVLILWVGKKLWSTYPKLRKLRVVLWGVLPFALAVSGAVALLLPFNYLFIKAGRVRR